MSTDPATPNNAATPEVSAGPPVRTDSSKALDTPQLKEKFVLRVVFTGLGLLVWGVVLGLSYATLSYDDPSLSSGLFVVVYGAIYYLPILTALAVAGLLVRTHHAQKIVYWITVVLFTIMGCIAAYLVHALSDPNLE